MLFTKYKKHITLSVLGVICIGFLALTALVIIFPHSLIDSAFSRELQEHQNPFLDTLMKLVSWFGYFPGSALIVVLVVALFLFFRYYREAVFLLITSLSGALSSLIKILVNRPRPTEPFVRIVQKVNEQSFPSGHVLFYIVFFGFLTVLMYRMISINIAIRIVVSAVSLLLVFSIPFSRIYLGAHWFTDVLGGFLLGILCLYTLCYFYFEKHVG